MLLYFSKENTVCCGHKQPRQQQHPPSVQSKPLFTNWQPAHPLEPLNASAEQTRDKKHNLTHSLCFHHHQNCAEAKYGNKQRRWEQRHLEAERHRPPPSYHKVVFFFFKDKRRTVAGSQGVQRLNASAFFSFDISG